MSLAPDGFGGEQLSRKLVSPIVYEWTQQAFEEHIAVKEKIRSVGHTALASDGPLGKQSFLQYTPEEDLGQSVTVVTHVLPDMQPMELLEDPGQYYFDDLAALVCSHLTALDEMRRVVPGDFSAIIPQVDVEMAAKQFRETRKNFVVSLAMSKQFFTIDHGSTRLSLKQHSEVPKLFNFDLESGFIFIKYPNELEVNPGLQRSPLVTEVQ